MIVYVSIGNDGGRLSQPEWARFAVQTEGPLIGPTRIHRAWYSPPTGPGQSACWCVEFDADAAAADIDELKERLADVGRRYGQPVTWAEAVSSEVLKSAQS